LLIKELKIRNFRSYSNEETSKISFGRGINTIVGKNNVGKSTILHALNHVKGGLDVNQDDYFSGITNEQSTVELNVNLSPSEINKFLTPLISRSSNIKKIIQFQSKNFPDVIYRKKGNSLQIKIGSIFIDGQNLYYKSIDPEKPHSAKVVWDINIGNELDHTSLDTLIKSLLTDADSNSNWHVRTALNLRDSLMNLLQTTLKIFPEFRLRPGGGDQRVFESYDGAAVAAVLNTLRNGDSIQIRKWKRIQDNFSQFYPSLVLDVRKPSGENPQVWVEKRDIDYDVTIDKLGAGISEFIVFITHLIDSKDSIFCMDNTEIHFHPHAQRKFMKLIETYSKNNQFILVTHSPNFIKSTFLPNIVKIREEKGHSIVNQLKPKWFTKNEIQKLERDMTPELREVFFSDFILLVEGSTETGALPIMADAIGKNLDERNVSIIKVAGKYFDIPIKLCIGFNLPYLVMCDKDALMNIETHYGRGENRIDCSSIVRLLLTFNLFNKTEKELIVRLNSIEEKGGKKRYNNDLFIQLQEIAKKHNIYVLSSKFETILKRAGYTKYFDEIEKQGIRSKPIIGKYVATKIVENGEPIPIQFLEVLNHIL